MGTFRNNFIEEEKQLTLKILSTAAALSEKALFKIKFEI